MLSIDRSLRRTRRYVWLAVLPLSLIVSMTSASVPSSPVIEVSTGLGDDATEPGIAAAAEGSYVVLWTEDVAPHPVLVRHYSIGGAALTVPLRVGLRSFLKRGVATASDEEGNLILAWEGGDIFGSPDELVFGRLADGDLSSATAPQRLGSVSNSLDALSVARSPSGEFAVSYNEGLGSDNFVQIFDSNGDPLSEILDTPLHPSNEDPDIAHLSGTEFVVSWENSFDGSILGQVFTETGLLDGAFLLSTEGSHVAVSGHSANEFVAAWETPKGIEAGRFESNGQPIGASIPIAPGSFPDIATREDRSFIVTWQSDEPIGQNPGNQTIRAAEFDALNEPAGGIFQVSEAGGIVRHEKAALTIVEDGYAIAWRAVGSGLAQVQARAFRPQSEDLELSVSGACPGTASLEIAGAAPLTTITVALAGLPDSNTRPDGACTGMAIGIGEPDLLLTSIADRRGTARLEVELGRDACGASVQAFELGRCATSAVVTGP